ncbi:hypothetical protein A2U01_0098354, partial [Trifolium medium]|nr:hypothetical protein [Trifolium medium]
LVLADPSRFRLRHEGTLGMSAIIRDSAGMVMSVATWKSKGFVDPFAAEAMALLNTVT